MPKGTTSISEREKSQLLKRIRLDQMKSNVYSSLKGEEKEKISIWFKRFKNLVFYFHGCYSKTHIEILAERIAEIGGKVVYEYPCPPDTTHIITALKVSRELLNKNDLLYNVNTQWTFSGGDAITKHQEILKYANNKDIKIWPLNKLERLIQILLGREEIRLYDHCLLESVNGRPIPFNQLSKSSALTLFKGHYLLCQDSLGISKPIGYREYDSDQPTDLWWPILNFRSMMGQSAFILFKRYVDQLKPDWPECGSLEWITPNDGDADFNMVHVDKGKHVNYKPLGKSFYNRPGYCENCFTKYQSYANHILDKNHMNYIRNASNFSSLDKLIKQCRRQPIGGPNQTRNIANYSNELSLCSFNPMYPSSSIEFQFNDIGKLKFYEGLMKKVAKNEKFQNFILDGGGGNFDWTVEEFEIRFLKVLEHQVFDSKTLSQKRIWDEVNLAFNEAVAGDGDYTMLELDEIKYDVIEFVKNKIQSKFNIGDDNIEQSQMETDFADEIDHCIVDNEFDVNDTESLMENDHNTPIINTQPTFDPLADYLESKFKNFNIDELQGVLAETTDIIKRFYEMKVQNNDHANGEVQVEASSVRKQDILDNNVGAVAIESTIGELGFSAHNAVIPINETEIVVDANRLNDGVNKIGTASVIANLPGNIVKVVDVTETSAAVQSDALVKINQTSMDVDEIETRIEETTVNQIEDATKDFQKASSFLDNGLGNAVLTSNIMDVAVAAENDAIEFEGINKEPEISARFQSDVVVVAKQIEELQQCKTELSSNGNMATFIEKIDLVLAETGYVLTDKFEKNGFADSQETLTENLDSSLEVMVEEKAQLDISQIVSKPMEMIDFDLDEKESNHNTFSSKVEQAPEMQRDPSNFSADKNECRLNENVMQRRSSSQVQEQQKNANTVDNQSPFRSCCIITDVTTNIKLPGEDIYNQFNSFSITGKIDAEKDIEVDEMKIENQLFKLTNEIYDNYFISSNNNLSLKLPDDENHSYVEQAIFSKTSSTLSSVSSSSDSGLKAISIKPIDMKNNTDNQFEVKGKVVDRNRLLNERKSDSLKRFDKENLINQNGNSNRAIRKNAIPSYFESDEGMSDEIGRDLGIKRKSGSGLHERNLKRQKENNNFE